MDMMSHTYIYARVCTGLTIAYIISDVVLCAVTAHTDF
jgi:hypothetical protein